MLTPKGKDEILNLISSDLVRDWGETEQTLKNVVRMLLTQRPDLIKLYFLPVVWQKIIQLERKEAATAILATMEAAVVEANHVPPITTWAQARFYFNTRIKRYQVMAKAWCEEYPQHCPKHFSHKQETISMNYLMRNNDY